MVLVVIKKVLVEVMEVLKEVVAVSEEVLEVPYEFPMGCWFLLEFILLHYEILVILQEVSCYPLWFRSVLCPQFSAQQLTG